MSHSDLEVLRMRLRIALLERLVLMTAFSAPLGLHSSSEQSRQDLTRWLDKNGESVDKSFGAQLSTITLFDGLAVADFDGLPASASRWL
jgi:hypothetical protein